jgi:light-regulated signal transduction histidine kinase (bacteriophytochrome)
MIDEVATGDGADRSSDTGCYAKAILNILADFSEEKTRLANVQKAIQNILDDFADEKSRLGDTQRSILNILEDAAGEKTRIESTQKAILNILEDAAGEKVQLESAQKATLNILEDFDDEKNKVDRINREMAREIAERKRAEESLEAANKELEAFSYSVSHDLRTPLRSIDGFSQALLEDYADSLDEHGRDYLHRVRSASQRMSQLIDDMLKLSRVTRTDLRREEVDLSGLAQEIAAEQLRSQPDRVVDLTIASGLRVHGDQKLLRIAIENLLGNAWKFTGKRFGARIEFGMTHRGGAAAFFVRDNGAGFDMAYVGRLFGAFQRLHDSHEFPGTGIGLATVQRVIIKHGGRIWAEGKVNEGATFYFTIPKEESREAL